MENWKQYKYGKNTYLVSDLGNIARILRPQTNNITRYKQITLSDKAIGRKVEYVHRLVIESFGNKIKKDTVNHIDFDRLNNKITNLEWATYTEQNEHKYKHGKGIKYKDLYLKKSDIINEFLSGDLTKIEIARKYNVPSYRIISILKGISSERSRTRKFSNIDISDIKKMRAKGFSVNYIAKKYSVVKTTIYYWLKKEQ